MFAKRREVPGSVEDEREALQRQREEAARELDRLKRELAERVAAVQQKERALDEALVRAPRPPAGGPFPQAAVPTVAEQHAQALAARERDLQRRERELEQRLRELEQLEGRLRAREEALASAPPPDPDAARLAAIEARLAELRDAESLFLRTRQELAGRSDAVAARERLVSQRERELDAVEDHVAGPHVHELEERLRRLEQARQQPLPPTETTQGFADGLDALKRRGTRSRED